MPTYTFNPSLAITVGDEMNTITNNISQQLQELDSQVRTNLVEWEDEAKDSYAAAKAKWDHAAQRMHLHLSAARSALDQIANGYNQVTRAGAQAWGGYGVN